MLPHSLSTQVAEDWLHIQSSLKEATMAEEEQFRVNFTGCTIDYGPNGHPPGATVWEMVRNVYFGKLGFRKVCQRCRRGHPTCGL
ncbi:hypothetical protein CEXT_412991 [Caerostris extrusa]|uniref:Uncharacterized protein n=1 Tax=Caerostris extrusa TaxID=172846 RepID=A0AAV4N9E2_CAEEX|nr:hypothetical protein CEXT_412991 [Caerostris extrusa]